jgi:hypothetical protein
MFNPNITTSRNRQIPRWVTGLVIVVAIAGHLAGDARAVTE